MNHNQRKKSDFENEQESESIDNQILNSIILLRKKEFNQALLITNSLLEKYSDQLNLSQEFGTRLTRLLSLLSLKKKKNLNHNSLLGVQVHEN